MIRKNISPSNNNRQTPQQAPIGPHMIQVTPVHPNTLRPRYTLTIQTLRSTRAPWPVRKSASASFRKKHKRRHFGRFVCFFGFQSTGKTRARMAHLRNTIIHTHVMYVRYIKCNLNINCSVCTDDRMSTIEKLLIAITTLG